MVALKLNKEHFLGLRSAFSFLTVIPVSKKMYSYEEVAKNFHLAPVVGFIVGFIAGVFGYFLGLLLPQIIVGFLVLYIILRISGFHNVDGLFDLGDGLMVIGPPERKIEVMHDVNIGVGGLLLGFFILIITGIAIGEVEEEYLIPAVVVAEMGGKMVQMGSISFGRSSKTPVAGAFHEFVNKKTFTKGLAISFLILTPFLLLFENIEIFKEEGTHFLNEWDQFCYEDLLVFMGVFLLGIFSVMILMIRTAHKHFDAVTGDVAGASNEITRMTILLLIIIMLF